MTELNKNEILRLTTNGKQGRDFLIDFDSADMLAHFLDIPPGLPYPEEQFWVTLWDIDGQRELWTQTLPEWRKTLVNRDDDKPWKVTKPETGQQYTFASRSEVADFLYTRAAPSKFFVSVVLGSGTTRAESQSLRGDVWLMQHREQDARLAPDKIVRQMPYVVKRPAYAPTLDAQSGELSGLVSHEVYLGSHEEVRAYLSSATDASGFTVQSRDAFGAVQYEVGGHEWLAKHFPDAPTRKPTLEEEFRAVRLGLQEFVEQFERLTMTMREAFETMRAQEAPADWEEGETGLDYRNWVKTQYWPDGATCATMDKRGGCCWWHGEPVVTSENDLGWKGSLVERFHDPAVPFRGVDWRLSLLRKPEGVDGQEA